MSKISNNVWLGGLIIDLNELPRLANEKKSVVISRGMAGAYIIRPAAFIVQWSIAMIMNQKIYYAIHDRDIAQVEFEEP